MAVHGHGQVTKITGNSNNKTTLAMETQVKWSEINAVTHMPNLQEVVTADKLENNGNSIGQQFPTRGNSHQREFQAFQRELQTRTSIASNIFDWLWDFSTTFRRRHNLFFFNSDFKLFDDASEFWVLNLFSLQSSWEFFFNQFSIGTRALVRSSTILLS